MSFTDNTNSADKFVDGNLEEDKPTSMEKITRMMNITFDSIIIVIMFLCFFALSANMSANLYDQAKEIGVMRAMGLKKVRVMLLFFYEALIVVLASSILGVMIGLIVGYAFCL